MSEEKSLIKIDDPKSVFEFLQQPLTKIAECITGLLISESKDLKFSAGKLVQASIKGKLFSQLGKEIREYIEKGKIKDDFLSDPKNFQSLHELLKFIDEAIPDEERFQAMKSLFFKSVFSDTDEKDKVLAYQFMQIAKEINSGDLLVLKATHEIVSGKEVAEVKDINQESATMWLIDISCQIGHKISSLVELHEKKLMDLKLIGERIYSDRSGFQKTKYYRLTELGYKFCEFIIRK